MTPPTVATKEKKVSKDGEFHELFMHELKDIYWAEKHLAEKLPALSDKASSKNLSTAIRDHKKETDNQVKRLEKVFESLDEKPQAVTCEAMKGLLEESDEVLEETEANSNVRDAGIIIACQKVEHYEIAAYGSLIHMSKVMGHKESTRLLLETLEEEKHADALLNKIAKEEVNKKAMQD